LQKEETMLTQGTVHPGLANQINAACAAGAKTIRALPARLEVVEWHSGDREVKPQPVSTQPPSRPAGRRDDDRMATMMLCGITERARLLRERRQLEQEFAELQPQILFNTNVREIREIRADLRTIRRALEFNGSAIADVDGRIALLEQYEEVAERIIDAEAAREKAQQAVGDAELRAAELRQLDAAPAQTQADRDRHTAGIAECNERKASAEADVARFTKQIVALKGERNELRSKLAA
jgi:hypothetical protein